MLCDDLQRFEANVRQLKALWELYLSHLQKMEEPPAYASFTRRALSNLIDLRVCERPAFARFTLNGAKGKVEYGLVSVDDKGERLEPHAAFLFDTHGKVVSEPRLVESIACDPLGAQVLHLHFMRDLCEAVALGSAYSAPPDRLVSSPWLFLRTAFPAIASRILRRRNIKKRLARRLKDRRLHPTLPAHQHVNGQSREGAYLHSSPSAPTSRF